MSDTYKSYLIAVLC
ncbi:DUF1270 family protein, partial [Staphylococcus aureus]